LFYDSEPPRAPKKKEKNTTPTSLSTKKGRKKICFR